MSGRQLLFFDLDDTLLDHRGAEEEAQRETFARFASLFDGVPFEAWLSAYREANGGLWLAYGRGEVDRETLHRRRFTDPLANLGLDASRGGEMGAFYLERYRDAWRLNEGAEEALAQASGLGTVGVLSNGFRDLQRAKLERFDLGRWVEHVVLSEEVGSMKPAREIFDAAVRICLGSGGSNGSGVRKVYVGDSFETDVVGARRAGWLPVYYNPRRERLAFPALFVTRLADLGPILS